MIFICPKCEALFNITAENGAATYILQRYEKIDPCCGRTIEITCACKTPLSPPEHIIIDDIINKSLTTHHPHHELSIREAEELILDQVDNDTLNSRPYDD